MRPWIVMAVSCAVLVAGCSRPEAFHCTADDQCSSGVCRQNACAGRDLDGGDGADAARPLDSAIADAAPDAASAPASPRSECAEGLAMPRDASACVTAVCSALPDCCRVAWDEVCVQRVETSAMCAASCSQVAYAGDNEGFGGRRIPAYGSAEFTAFERVIANEPPPTEHRINKVAVADYDSDGRADLAVSSPHGWYVLRNESELSTVQYRLVASHLVPGGDTSLEDNVGGHHIAWADWDHDGDLDLAITYLRDGLYLIRHAPAAGVPFVQEAQPLLPTATLAFDWGDIDGDGDIDMVAAHREDGVILRNDGSGHFDRPTWAGKAHFGIRLCDLTDGGLPEVVTATQAGPLHVYRNGGLPLDQPADVIPNLHGQNHGEIRCGDLDGDGDLDVVVGSATSGAPVMRVYRNGARRGGLESDPVAGLYNGAILEALDIGDLNGDRRLDVVISFGGLVQWMENTTPAGGDLWVVNNQDPVPDIAETALDLGPEPAE